MAVATKVESPEPVRLAAEVLGPPPSDARKFTMMIVNTVVVAICGALAQIVTDHAAEIQNLLIGFASFLPGMLQGYAGLIVGSALTAVAAWLRARAQKNTQQKIVDSLSTQNVPPDIHKYYKSTGDGS